MATDAQIREWARGEGIEVPPRGRLAPAFRDRYAQAHPDELPEDDGEQLVDEQLVDTGEQAPATPAGLVPVDTGETPPRSPHRPRLRLIGGGRKVPADRKPRRPRRRTSLETMGSGAWDILASVTARRGLTPTARVLGMQAPVAGVIVEDALRGTLADRVLQPIARMGEKGGSVMALLAPPVLVSILTVRPQAAEEILPMLRVCLRQWALVAGPALKEKQKREEKAAAALDLPEGQTIDDLVEAWLEQIFTPQPDAGPVPDAA